MLTHLNLDTHTHSRTYRYTYR